MIEELTATEVLDLSNIDRPKCKVCGKDIIYKDTQIYFSKLKNKGVIFKGHTYKSIKKVNDKEYTLCVCEDCLRNKFPNITNISRTFNVMSEMTKFAFSISDEDYQSSRNKYAMTLEHMIEKYGEEEGNKIWENYCKRQAETNTFEYKKKKYGMTKREFKEFNKSRAVTEKNLIKKYGEEEGLKRWKDYVEKQKITKSWEYMVEKFGEEKAREINLKKINIRYTFKNKNGNGGICCVSKESQVFFNSIDKFISKKYETFYANKNREFDIIANKKFCSLDYYIPELKLCIEFNGSCYHGDPRVFRDDEYCNPFKKLTAKELREQDQERYKALEEEHGIKTYVVWELDYKNGIDIKDFIKNELKIDIL